MQLTVPMWHHYDIGAKFGPDATKNGNLNGLHHALSPMELPGLGPNLDN